MKKFILRNRWVKLSIGFIAFIIILTVFLVFCVSFLTYLDHGYTAAVEEIRPVLFISILFSIFFVIMIFAGMLFYYMFNPKGNTGKQSKTIDTSKIYPRGTLLGLGRKI